MFVELFKGKGLKNHRIRTRLGNNEVGVVSEGYFSHWNAKRAAKRMFPDLPRYDENGKEF